MGLRVGIDVGGTFTKAVALEPTSRRIAASATVLTTHRAERGVAEGIVEALQRLLGGLNAGGGERIELVAFSTTQAMNALLEGDVARVGVIGMGQIPELRSARKRTRMKPVALAPGRRLEVETAFVETTRGLPRAEIEEVLARHAAAGVGAVAASEAYSVDAPENESKVASLARARGMPTCAGHELTGTYGLEMRTLSAAVNASILPVIEKTASLVESALESAGLDVPLLVLRGDGGAMSIDAFRRTPVFTISSGPAAGAAAALHELGLGDGVVLEAGGTSSNICAIRRGRPTLRFVRVMGRPTCVRSLDSWVVGAGGGSMARLGRRRLAEVGPRSAHIAGLPYVCFSEAEELADAELARVSPRSGDPATYAALRSPGGTFAVTATCAANALGLVPPGDYAHGSSRAALQAFSVLGDHLRRPPEWLARDFLDRAAAKVAAAVDEAAHLYKLPRKAPLVALGGAAAVVAPAVAERVGRDLVKPPHAELLSSVGAALSLVRSEVERSARADSDPLVVAAEAERACVDSGAAPNTVSVETAFDQDRGVLRAVATGAVALESGNAGRARVDREAGRLAAAQALEVDAEVLDLVAETGYYRIYCENGSGRVAVVDPTGAVPLAERATQVIVAAPKKLREALAAEVNRAAVQLGVATLLPRVFLVAGPHLLDLSSARRAQEVLTSVDHALADHPERPVAIVAR